MLIIGFVLLGANLIYYPFIEWLINFSGESSKELIFRLIYYFGSIIIYIELMIAWSGFKRGYQNSGTSKKVAGSISAIQAGNIIASITHFIFAFMWILLRSLPPTAFIFRVLVVPLYICAYAYAIFHVIGYLVLGKEFRRVKTSEITPEPTLDFSPPPAHRR